MKKMLLVGSGFVLLLLLITNFWPFAPAPLRPPDSPPPKPITAAETSSSEAQRGISRTRVNTKKDPDPAFHPQPPDGWMVEVVRRQIDASGKKSYEPVPRAQVCVVGGDRSSFPESCRWFELTGGILAVNFITQEERYLDYGPSYLADAEGRVRIPPPDWGGLHLFGRHDHGRGSLEIVPSDKPPIRLVLLPDSVVRIQVVDGQGHPQAGVPVCLSLRNGPLGPLCTPSFETVGPEGIAEAHRIAELLESWSYRPGGKGRFSASLALPLAAPVEAILDPAALPAEPVRLVLPPTGSVRLDLPGTVSEKEDLVLAILGRRDDPFWDHIHLKFSYPEGYSIFPLFARVREGRVLFPHVGLDLELQARVLRASATGCGKGVPLAMAGPGPATPGQEVVFRGEAPPTIPVLSGRVVDAQGMPLDRRWFFFSHNDYYPIKANPNYRTDDMGRFRIRPPSPALSGPKRLVVIDVDGLSEPPLGGFQAFPRPVPASGFDIGDVRMAPFPSWPGASWSTGRESPCQVQKSK